MKRSTHDPPSVTKQENLFAGTGADKPRTVVLSTDPLATARQELYRRTVLTPNDRAARALRGGRSASVSLSARASRLLRSGGSFVASSLTRLLALRRAIADDGGWPDVRGTARRIEPVVSELLRAGLGVKPELEAALSSSPSVGARTKRVARLALAYSKLLKDSGELDHAEVLWRAAPAVRSREPLLVYGYSRLGAGEIAFVAALAAPGSVVVLPAAFKSSEDAAAELSAHGWHVRRDDRMGSEVGPQIAARFTVSVAGLPDERPAAPPLGVPDAALSTHSLADPEDEVRWVLARVKSLLASGVLPDDVVLVARDERAYGPLIRSVAAEFDVPVRLAYGVPIRESRLGEVAAGLIAAVGRRLPFEETARLLRHPLVRGLADESWATARAWHPEGPVEWTEAGAPAAELLAWPARASRTEYVRVLASTLEGLGVSGRAEGRDQRLLARLLKTLERSVKSGPVRDEDGPVDLAEFLEHLADVLDTVSVPVDRPGRGWVELHTPLAVFGARYRHVFVLGLCEGVFPQAVREDPVIDFQERAVLAASGVKLEDAEGAAEREELSFLAVLHAAGSHVTLTTPRIAGGSEQLPSPYLAALGVPVPDGVGVRAAASDLEALIASLPGSAGPAARAWQVERRREGAEAPDAYDGMTGVSVPARGPISATQLTSFGQCAFKWFGQYGLRLAELTEAEEEVSPLTAGSIFHDTLARAVQAAVDQLEDGVADDTEAFREVVVANLERAYDEAHAQREGRDERIRSKTWPLQKGENLDKLRRLVRSEAFIEPEARVSDLEKSFTAEWRGLSVRGTVDRIDVLTTSRGEGLVFTDYKLGKSAPRGAKGAKGTLSLDVQLPLYIEAAAPVLHPDAPVSAARYLSINGASVSKQVDPSKVDAEGLDALVDRFGHALSEGEFPLDPDQRQEACQYCAFDLVCRRGPRLSRKSAREAEERREQAA